MSYRVKHDSGSGLGLAAMLTLFLLMGGCNFAIYRSTQDTVTATVTEKGRVTTGSGDSMSSKYLIFTDAEVFENTDSWFAWKFDSSDVYGAIRPGQTCRFDVAGLRVRFLSWYRNILTAECGDGA